MLKKLFLIPLAALAVAACSDDEDITTPPKPPTARTSTTWDRPWAISAKPNGTPADF